MDEKISVLDPNHDWQGMCLAYQRLEREKSDEVGLGDPTTGRSTGPRKAAAALSLFDSARRGASKDCPGP